MPGLLFAVLGIGALVGALVTYLMGDSAHRAALKSSVGATATAALPPPKPPVVRVGEPIFALPQRQWGRCECVTLVGDTWRYGVRFKNGQAVALGEKEVVR
jgi:hypothetical protein